MGYLSVSVDNTGTMMAINDRTDNSVHFLILKLTILSGYYRSNMNGFALGKVLLNWGSLAPPARHFRKCLHY